MDRKTAHDLRNPLTLVVAYTQLSLASLPDTAENARTRERLRKALEAAERLNALIEERTEGRVVKTLNTPQLSV